MIDDMQVYIANLGKYNEGELVGDWFSFPLDESFMYGVKRGKTWR